MATIALRSPQYKSITAGTNTAYVLCVITIGGNIEYTLRKNAVAGDVVLFEISELCRDFINITFNGTYTPQTLTIQTTVRAYNSSDALINGSTFNDIGYDGYGTFMEGDNPTIPFSNRPRWLLNTDPNTLDVYYIYVPNNTAGSLPYIAVDASMGYLGYSAQQTSILASSNYGQYLVNINRVDCTKYGDGHKITFVNKFGALQDIWFFLKSVNTTSKRQEQFQRNIVTSTGTYDVNTHTKQDFNTVANTGITLNSGYYPEWANQWFEQLLLSEQVWLTRIDPFDSADTQVVPVNVRKSSMVKKTSLNDKLINYTFDFDMSFDYINNIR
jgi:hypothetical protein